ncbi:MULTISPECIES: Hpt domain-containing protein [unclassified Thiomonas]|uniref:Hpt domain-containing protein n=1 Tax=unclassified Thiomonas TaxID=2625466 RepID=UPI0012A89123|nr:MULTISPECIES: Hpt domain-containing protein [unclassified Thiomonas]VDY03671.1 protein of unknown function [Thiomonas sp. Bio17B3]VDY09153.1 protein of unknown function [Thiomonas sp. Sup16B3]VDY11920.1 protein of unknown function [Thiomonas sp. OC7]VDY18863.1 protein of unknown function [Thiomonas sp. CB2]
MDNDILLEFLAESRELLSQAQDQLLRLESQPDDSEALSAIFRAFHTLKGGAGFLEAQNMVDWCHHLEDLFDKMRSGKLRATAPMIDAILRATDVITAMLDDMARGENPPPGPAALGADIQAFARGETPALPEVAKEATNKAAKSPPPRRGRAGRPLGHADRTRQRQHRAVCRTPHRRRRAHFPRLRKRRLHHPRRIRARARRPLRHRPGAGRGTCWRRCGVGQPYR